MNSQAAQAATMQAPMNEADGEEWLGSGGLAALSLPVAPRSRREGALCTFLPGGGPPVRFELCGTEETPKERPGASA